MCKVLRIRIAGIFLGKKHNIKHKNEKKNQMYLNNLNRGQILTIGIEQFHTDYQYNYRKGEEQKEKLGRLFQ